jgi:glycosyltransferase involved in cell wall biosynthesis
MRVYIQERQGLVNSLNRGFSLSLGEYIARMDADDISLPARLERQVEFMDKNPDIGISGTWLKTIGDAADQVWEYPCDHRTMKSKMLFQCVLAHPSVIIRKTLFSRIGFIITRMILTQKTMRYGFDLLEI